MSWACPGAVARTSYSPAGSSLNSYLPSRSVRAAARAFPSRISVTSLSGNGGLILPVRTALPDPGMIRTDGSMVVFPGITTTLSRRIGKEETGADTMME